MSSDFQEAIARMGQRRERSEPPVETPPVVPLFAGRRSKPLVIIDEVYEIEARVTFTYRCGNKADALIKREWLRSGVLKLCSYLERKMGLTLEAEWGNVRLVGEERREAEG